MCDEDLLEILNAQNGLVSLRLFSKITILFDGPKVKIYPKISLSQIWLISDRACNKI